MNIVEATIHQLLKESQTVGPSSVTMNPRPSPLPIDSLLQTLCADLLALYTKTANSYGTLGANPTLHSFPVKLAQYIDLHIDFQEFTMSALSLIADRMKDSIFANGGYAMFLRYTHADQDFLLIAMLKLKAGAGIDEETLSLEPTLSIDLGLLNEAARINMTKWRSAEEPYLSFITGKVKQGDVTNYFRDALACQNFTSASHHTKELIRAADDFVASRTDLPTSEAKSHERVLMRKRLYDCFAANSNEVVLQTLAAAIHPGGPQDFIDWVREESQASQYQMNERFKPDRNTYNRIKRISGKIHGSITVGFDVADVHERRVYYDPAIDGIVLKNPPLSLKQAIEDNASN